MTMSSNKRSFQGSENKAKKKKFRSDGTPVWTKPHVDGPGVWASCIKGKEKGTVGELYDLFESLAEELWPVENPQDDETTKADASPNDQGGLSLEEKIANEVSTIKKPKRVSRFGKLPSIVKQTPNVVVVFISCKPPVDPVELVLQHVKNVKETGIARTRYTHRLVPVSDTCVANPPEIQSLCQRVFEPFFSKNPDKKYTYKIELRVRNHTTMQRMDLIQTIALCVPQGHTVSLTEPDIFILVEVFKSTCGVSVVEDYYKLAKFNVVELANMHNKLEPTTAE